MTAGEKIVNYCLLNNLVYSLINFVLQTVREVQKIDGKSVSRHQIECSIACEVV